MGNGGSSRVHGVFPARLAAFFSEERGCAALQTWVALATANGQAREQESDERRRKAEHGGTEALYSRTAPGKIRAISVDKAGLFSWRFWARRFVCSVTQRRGGPPAHLPSGRGPGCGFASDRAIPPPAQAGGAFV